MNLSTPNRMIWIYFAALRRRVRELQKISDADLQKIEIAFCIMLSVIVVETFLNVFFRVVVSEKEFIQCSSAILNDIEKRKGLAHKLKTWPQTVFGKQLDGTATALLDFEKIRTRRNSLMHFTSSHETLALEGIQVTGLVDTSAIDTLAPSDAENALNVAEEIVREIFRLRGVSEKDIPGALHAWTGKPPF